MVAPLWVNRDYLTTIDLSSAYCRQLSPLTMQNFVAIVETNAGVIRDQKFVLPEKVGQSSPKSLKTCYPLRPPISYQISSKSVKQAWRKALQIWASDKKIFFFVTDGQKRDYLSRDSQCVRGATRN